MAEELEAEDLLHILVREFRRLKGMGQNVWNRLTAQQRRRAGIERGIHQDRWGPDRDPNRDPRDSTAQLERDVARAQEQAQDARTDNQNLRDDISRLQQNQNENQNPSPINDLDGDGRHDGDVAELSDANNNHVPDTQEHATEAAQQNRNENEVDDAARALAQADADKADAEKQKADAEKQKKDAQSSQQDREGGIDPLTAGTAAVGAAAAADEFDDQLDEQHAADLETDGDPKNPATEAEGQNPETDAERRGPGTEAERQDPATEADNVRETETDTGQEPPSPYATDEADVNSPAADAENPQLDADGNPTVDTDNAVDADNDLAAESGQEPPSPYATDRLETAEPAVETEDPARGSDLSDGLGDDGIEADNDSIDAETATDRGADLGDNVDPNRRYVDDGQDVDQGASNEQGADLADGADPNRQYVNDGEGVETGTDFDQADPAQQVDAPAQEAQPAGQPAFRTAGDQQAANEFDEQNRPGAQQTALAAQREQPVNTAIDGMRAETAQGRAQNPPAKSQNEMSPEEIGQQQHRAHAGSSSAAEAPGYDGGELANSGASGGQRGYADRTRGQGSRGQDSRGTDGPPSLGK